MYDDDGELEKDEDEEDVIPSDPVPHYNTREERLEVRSKCLLQFSKRFLIISYMSLCCLVVLVT